MLPEHFVGRLRVSEQHTAKFLEAFRAFLLRPIPEERATARTITDPIGFHDNRMLSFETITECPLGLVSITRQCYEIGRTVDIVRFFGRQSIAESLQIRCEVRGHVFDSADR